MIRKGPISLPNGHRVQRRPDSFLDRPVVAVLVRVGFEHLQTRCKTLMKRMVGGTFGDHEWCECKDVGCSLHGKHNSNDTPERCALEAPLAFAKVEKSRRVRNTCYAG